MACAGERWPLGAGGTAAARRSGVRAFLRAGIAASDPRFSSRKNDGSQRGNDAYGAG